MFNILVAEDDRGTRLLMKAVLEGGGYNVITAENGSDALEVLAHEHVDLIVLDVMMPVMDGYEFTKILRQGGDETPILMVTAKQGHESIKEGFMSGTDDYMVKPVDEEEMLLRISALLRRAKIVSEKKLTVGQSVFDYNGFTCTVMGETMELPQKEFLLIFKLLSNSNQIFTRRSLMDEIWSMDSDSDERTVDVHINRLRERFKNNTDFEIITVRGLGYKAVAKQ
ncbi:MAG: response regulator transcription factor [Ruminococcaceae bacterium]|nr:response regulator transcription factor [Oscillospiraceae bacterium]